MAEMEELTSGASGRIIPLFKNIRQRSTVLSYDSLRRSLLFIQSIFFWFLLVLPRTKPSSSAASSPAKRRRKEEEDTLRRRALAQDFPMLDETDDGAGRCESATSLFYGVRRNALFVRSWFPVTGELKYVSSANSLIHVISFGVFFLFYRSHFEALTYISLHFSHFLTHLFGSSVIIIVLWGFFFLKNENRMQMRICENGKLEPSKFCLMLSCLSIKTKIMRD